MTELLRETTLSIERATAVKRAGLPRFRDGKQSSKLDLAERLAAHIGVVSRRERNDRE